MNDGVGVRREHSAEEEREAKLAALRLMLDRSIRQGGDVSEDELEAALDAEEAQLASQGSEVPGALSTVGVGHRTAGTGRRA